MGPRDGTEVLKASTALALCAIGLILLPPGPSAPVEPWIQTPGTTPGTVSMNVTLDGRPVTGAQMPDHPLVVHFDHSLRITVAWSAQGGKLGTPVAVVVGGTRTTFIYLGQPIAGRETDAINAPAAKSGTLNTSLDTSVDQYLVEGLYLTRTTLWAANGTVIGSTDFYVRADAPEHLTLANLGLLAIGAYLAVDFLVGLVPPKSRDSRALAPTPERSGSPARAGVDGVALGVTAIVLAQQLGTTDLAPFQLGLESLVASALVGGAVLVGVTLAFGRLRRRRSISLDPRTPRDPPP